MRTFASHGVASTSLRKIAEAAGVSIGLVQHYFGTKASLVAAVDQYVLQVLADALEPRPLPDPPADPLPEIGRRVTSLYTENADVIDYVGRVLVDGDPTGAVIFDSLLAISEAQRDRFAEQQLLTPDLDPVWGALNPLILRIGAVLLRNHIDRHLDEHFAEPSQLRRWDTAVNELVRKGQFAERVPKPDTDQA